MAISCRYGSGKESGRDRDAFSAWKTNQDSGAIEFAALMRKLDKIDSSYRR